ncbi:C-5 cytosine methyltransferase [Moelleriella libera RCEF 2490]|uniref:DNA (cytosine-5-)-methyltransferase n=1 Tax=Moelleriella libera RCEF 2490 TaxID=1081109 RepID=A0A162I9P9_9HYPO|nr:C-5 cytosine methyltransferase [Moelleriella libera RCEF 2490]
MNLLASAQTSFQSIVPRESSVASSCTLGFSVESDERLSPNAANCTFVDLTADDEVPDPGDRHDGKIFPDQPSLSSSADCQIGDCVEVQTVKLDEFPVDFIQVMDISRQTAQGKLYRGIPFMKTQHLRGMISHKPNELCKLVWFRKRDGRRPDDFPLLIDVREESVLSKRNLVTTNALYPKFNDADLTPLRDQQRADSGGRSPSTPLICRWKWTRTFLEKRNTTSIDEEAIERISPHEVPQAQYRALEHVSRMNWRGITAKGGSWDPDPRRSHTTRPQLRRRPRQKYTLFDAFCRAGGVSRGAQSVGFRVTHAVDKSPAVWNTYSINFPDTRLHKTSIDRFIRTRTSRTRIYPDVLHISPPCQYFSPAHTRPSDDDEDNTDAQLCCAALVHMLRPRLITIEQTFGMAFERHQMYLFSIIGDLTDYGYSVRWKIVELCTWGLPQSRKRLIILAAGPGERLPTYPPATHSASGGNSMMPYLTIRKALSKLSVGDDLHDLSSTQIFRPRRPALDFDGLSGTICTASDTSYYPDGTRSYTLREHACLQGFPMLHKFLGQRYHIKRQIGNAFPPSTVKVLYRHLERWLLREDKMSQYVPGHDRVMTLDD